MKVRVWLWFGSVLVSVWLWFGFLGFWWVGGFVLILWWLRGFWWSKVEEVDGGGLRWWTLLGPYGGGGFEKRP